MDNSGGGRQAVWHAEGKAAADTAVGNGQEPYPCAYRCNYGRKRALGDQAFAAPLGGTQRGRGGAQSSHPRVGWLKNDTLMYQAKSLIPQGNYNLQIGIRHMATYIYRDIWLEISCYSPNYTYNDTLHLMLSDSKGNWFGKGIGGLIQHSIELPKDFIIKDSCCLPTFQITHLMKDSLLKGINDIGIQINEIP